MAKKGNRKVLIVDDNEIDLFINQKVLEFNDFASEIVNLQSGQRAIDYLNEISEEEIPDVILLDLNMPLVDGFRFLLEFSKMSAPIREKAAIIILTSSDNLRDKEKIAVNPDVKLFLSKPLTDEKLEQIITHL